MSNKNGGSLEEQLFGQDGPELLYVSPQVEEDIFELMEKIIQMAEEGFSADQIKKRLFTYPPGPS